MKDKNGLYHISSISEYLGMPEAKIKDWVKDGFVESSISLVRAEGVDCDEPVFFDKAGFDKIMSLAGYSSIKTEHGLRHWHKNKGFKEVKTNA